MENAFSRVKPKWKKLFMHKDVNPLLIKVFKKIDKTIDSDFSLLRPHINDMFNAFTYFDIDELKVIIIGQDPYPKIEDACGLSFAYKDHGSRNSLLKIYECLQYNGYNNIDIHDWPSQGVLLLNRYLTRSATNVDGKIYNGGSQKPNMHTFWNSATQMIIQKTMNYMKRNNKQIPILMWGDKAKMEIKHSINMYWAHPSPASPYNQKDNPKHFKYCDHFTNVNKYLISIGLNPIAWGKDYNDKETLSSPIELSSPTKNSPPSQPPRVVAFTDGGCTGNGKKNAKASFGVYFPKQFLDFDNYFDESIGGLVPNDITPTNNRGELLAIIIALEKILTLPTIPPILIITDSGYSMNIINSWIYKWYENDDKFRDRKNPDYLVRLYKILMNIKIQYGGYLLHNDAKTQYHTKKELPIDWKGLTVIHQRSHKKPPQKDTKVITGGYDYEKYIGNDTVDKICTKHLNS